MALRASGATATLHAHTSTTHGAFSPLSLMLVLHAAIAVGDRTKSTRTPLTQSHNVDATLRGTTTRCSDGQAVATLQLTGCPR